MATQETLKTVGGKPIPGFSNYRVHPNGQIWNVKKGKFQTVRMINGYPAVVISQNGKAAQLYIRVATATAYVPNPDPENLTTVININHNKLDNNYTNLKWATHSEACKFGKTGEKDRTVKEQA